MNIRGSIQYNHDEDTSARDEDAACEVMVRERDDNRKLPLDSRAPFSDRVALDDQEILR